MLIFDGFVTVVPLIGYCSQYRLIRANAAVGSFSIDVCAILLIANILRIVFWFTNGFALNLLIQSFLIIIIELATLKLCINLGYKNHDDLGHVGFWRWDNFSSFVMFLLGFIIVLSATTFFSLEEKLEEYGEIVGLTGLSLEATLGFPQIMANYRNKSTQGLSYFMVCMWVIGDLTKTIYFIVEAQPFPFLFCGIIQSITDFILVGQIIQYWNNSKYFSLSSTSKSAEETKLADELSFK